MVGGRSHLVAPASVRRSGPPRHGSPPPEPPTLFRIFHDEEWGVVERSLRVLEDSGFYWGPLPVDKAHALLEAQPVGTFLVRDSTQSNHLFSLSVRARRGPVSMRVQFKRELFWFDNAHFDCMVKLLEHCVDCSRGKPFVFDGGDAIVFTSPLRKDPMPKLQQLCRRNIIRHFGRDGVAKLPLVPSLQKYIEEFPFKI
ncbi:suppressor of cytokine signaling 1-like [Leucoraja erinacea]|uniref:suppressor of cytokine signaling 1-like n=1 Tax=Leucoraja erinaceus TaxID=7782 RepID=UPI002458B00A|nr:suppressor of cytokine signaling 1-like [Leucoraja erinacea]